VTRRPPAVAPRSNATLDRSVRLLAAFRHEQSDADTYYRMLAADSVRQLSGYASLTDARVLDVGGGPGYFGQAFIRAGAHYLWVEPGLGEFSGLGQPGPGMVVASGMALPFRTGAVDVCYSSNVLEHVPRPWMMADEMVRVTRTGGLVFCAFTLWWSPWGGHETSPWHLGGGERAAARYQRVHGRPPKNRFGESLFVVRAGDALRWARGVRDAELVAAIPRYHPWWAQWTARVPGLREVVCWNLALVLRRR
jgi:SAM-dependent methyltransferase